MRELTKAERHEVYKMAASLISNRKQMYMCNAIKKSVCIITKTEYELGYQSLRNYPEFLSKAPEGWDYLRAEPWIIGRNDIDRDARVALLTQCIEETK